MPHKILIINSSADKNNLLQRAFKELARQDFNFILWSKTKTFEQNNWPTNKIFLGPSLKNKAGMLLFSIMLPFIQLKLLASLIRLKIKRQADLIICLNLNEKIIVTVLAYALKIKVVWLESPATNYRQINKFLLGLYKLNCGLAEIIVFNNYGRIQLENFGGRKKISLIYPGAKPNQYQENIFNKLAAAKQANFHRKYFTVGAITELNQRQKIETIFQAIKICSPVIANIQLIIIGEGEERKNLSWLAKKMQIENLVWLVGEQEQLKKWLDGLDVYLAAGDALKLDDYGNILEAMAAGLPILAARNIGLEDLVIENKTGSLLETDNSEMLARQIIKLHQDKKLRFQLGRNGRERVNQFFTLDKMAESLKNTFNINSTRL
ncbi:MAG: glycosyltransferase family 4 protein [bacterium]|nr:glycosyltransferase family 4 protein [bacterium]